MKKYLFLLTVLSLFSCREEEIQSSVETEAVHADIRSIEEAIDAAAKAPSVFCDDEATRSAENSREVDISNVKVIGNFHTRGGNSTQPLLYVVNYKDDRGYAIISASYSTPEILGFSDYGHYQETDKVEGPALGVELAKDYVAANISNPPVYKPISQVDTLTLTVGSIVTYKWGQTGFESYYCPTPYVGCANLALAEIMAYYGYPVNVDLTYPEADISSITMDWDDICMHTYDYEALHTPCLTTEDGHSQLARFCRQLGYLSYSSYSSDGTGTSRSGTLIPLIRYGYSFTNWRSYSDTCLVSPINRHHQILMSGYSVSPRTGHAWVIDRYKKLIITMRNPYAEPHPDIVTEKYYNHVNWGWYGIGNGYYYDGIFNTSQIYSHDTDTPTYDPTLNYAIDLEFIEVYR